MKKWSMDKIKLVIDCTCEMGVDEAAKRGIVALPMRVCFDDAEYNAGKDINNDEFYEKLLNCKNLPKTQAINPAEYVAAIKPLLDEGHQVLVMCISSGLSSTFDNLVQAQKELDNPNLQIFDTETFTLAYYALVVEAKKMIDKGWAMEKIVKRLEELREKVEVYTIIDNMKYLIKGGRISFVKGLLAKGLHVKPIIGVVKKKLAMVAKGFGYNSAKKQMLRLTQNVNRDLPIYLGHIHASEKADDFKKIFDYEWAEKREIGPIVGTHGGPGAVGLAFFNK